MTNIGCFVRSPLFTGLPDGSGVSLKSRFFRYLSRRCFFVIVTPLYQLDGTNCNPRLGTALPRIQAAILIQRRSASVFTAGSITLRMAAMPGERNAQYRLNFLRDSTSVATARVSVRNIDWLLPSGFARSVQMILT